LKLSIIMVKSKLIRGLAGLVLGGACALTPLTGCVNVNNFNKNLENYVRAQYSQSSSKVESNLNDDKKKMIKYFPSWVKDLSSLDCGDELSQIYLASGLYKPILNREIVLSDDFLFRMAQKTSKYDHGGFVNLEVIKTDSLELEEIFKKVSRSGELYNLGLDIRKIPTEHFFYLVIQQEVMKMVAGSIGK